MIGGTEITLTPDACLNCGGVGCGASGSSMLWLGKGDLAQ